MTTAPERRAYPRCAIDLPVDIIVDGTTYPARSADLSLDGLAVIVDRTFPLVRPSTVRFGVDLRYLDLTPTRLEGSARVLRVEARQGGVLIVIRPQSIGTWSKSLSLRPLSDSLPEDDHATHSVPA